ncbi:MAG: hypothetical protein QOE70_330 [Chthoniobacter sp.]|jgi:PAS domain S-box-containing protein|nr:hypothetical protein [Chthoniobacter sp.]
MKFPLLALGQDGPAGFERRTELSQGDLRRAPFALFAASLEAGEAALQPWRGRIVGIVVTEAAPFQWRDLGDGLYHLGLPAHLRGDLADLLQPWLGSLENVLRLQDQHREQQLESTRASEDRTRMVREFSDLRASLVKEIAERRSVENALQAAHVELEARVIQRTGELAQTNAALEAEMAERRLADQALAQERQRLSTLMDSVPDNIYFKDEESRFLQANRAVAQRFHLHSPDEVIGKSDRDFFAPQHAEAAREDELQVMKTETPLIGKIEHETFPDGRQRWALTTKMPLRDVHGQVVGTFGISRDVTALKNAEENLRDANARLREVLADLTRSHEELKAAQLQLIQAEKMQSVGRLAAGIAHEVKNPLAIIEMGLGCLIRDRNPESEDFETVVKEMHEAVERANTVISGLLDFSSSKQLDIREADLSAVVEKSLRLMKHELINGKITAVRRLDRHLPTCRLDTNKIEQVFINIFTNACHAMPKGGALTVTTYATNLGDGEDEWTAGDRSGTRFRKGERVAVVEVRDTGSGIPEEELAKIFDPFFTTKPTGKGTGLGLTVAKKIVDLHGGRLKIDNALEGGAIVTVTFKIEQADSQ